MAVTYTWDIETVDLLNSHNGNADVVYRVVWKCTATSDTGATKDQIGVVELDISNVGVADTFVPIAEVSKQQIIDWVVATVPTAVIYRDLNPEVRSLNFAKVASTITVSEQILNLEAEKSSLTPPEPITPPEL
jgi:hypothetical protein